ncbi:MAG: GNAT family N-acetyltransferase [Anaerolineae bacterium]
MSDILSDELRIVPIVEEHIAGFQRCLDVVARERRYLALVEAPPIESVAVFVRRNIAEGYPQFVAVLDGEVVGWCDIIPIPTEGFTHCGRLGMGVLPAHRGRGIGRSLLEHTVARAREIGLERVELEVYASNTEALQMYESAGFVTEGVKRGARKIDGTVDDVIEMVLFLTPEPAPDAAHNPLELGER